MRPYNIIMASLFVVIALYVTTLCITSATKHIIDVIEYKGE